MALTVACQRPGANESTGARQPVTPVDVQRPSPQVQSPPEQRTERWSRAYSSDPIEIDTIRALLTEAALPDGNSAAFTLGRRVPLTELDAVVGTLPSSRLDEFLRGMTGRALGATPMPAPWRLRWQRDPPSIALATLIGKNAVVLDPPLAAQSESLLLDGDLAHQIAGARSLQNPSVPLPSTASLVGLHPVAFPLAVRSLSLRGGVPPTLWLSLIGTIGARVHPNPRSWGNAWISLMDALPTMEPTIQGALLALEPMVTQVDLQPVGVLAAYRCAVALRFDRIDRGRRTELCATGTEIWRALATLAERARPPAPPAGVAEQLRTILAQPGADARVFEAVAQAAVLLPVANARPIVLQIADQRDPGVLAALLEGLHEHPALTRALPAAALDRLLQAPFDLPEAPSLEARAHAIEIRRALGRAAPAPATSVRALLQANTPDGGVAPAAALIAPAVTAGTWVIETTAGMIRVALRADTAPQATRLLMETTRDGSYRGTTFHRVVPGFVAQGGDPRGDGYGGTSRITPTELSGGRFERGAVGIALAGLDTGGSQFFITLTDSPHLDARYPWVGQVISGMDVADRLMTGDEIVRVALEAPGTEASEP